MKENTKPIELFVSQYKPDELAEYIQTELHTLADRDSALSKAIIEAAEYLYMCTKTDKTIIISTFSDDLKIPKDKQSDLQNVLNYTMIIFTALKAMEESGYIRINSKPERKISVDIDRHIIESLSNKPHAKRKSSRA